MVAKSFFSANVSVSGGASPASLLPSLGSTGWAIRVNCNIANPSARGGQTERRSSTRSERGCRALSAFNQESASVAKLTRSFFGLNVTGREVAKDSYDRGLIKNCGSLVSSEERGRRPGLRGRSHPQVMSLAALLSGARFGVMQKAGRSIYVALLTGAVFLTGAPVFAFEGTTVGGGSDAAIPVAIAQPGSAKIMAKSSAVEPSLTALQYAAEGGHPVAQWKLGRMYADGVGVLQDNLRAFDYFSQIANSHAEDSPTAPQAAIVAKAFVELGRYFIDGIPGSHVKPNPARAREMLSYAASYFGNADAQYDLAKLYLKGVGTPRDLKYGARWLGLAAQKGQHHAQAMLGQMLFNGDQLPRQAARGLMWLTLARDSASSDEVWIKDSYNKAISRASEDDRAMALKLIESWVQGRRD